MTTEHLLPVGSSDLEKKAAQILRLAVQNPIIIADLINPERCPEHLLPYLAWTMSVDKWDEKWTAEVKREAIKQSFFIHKKKGTINAIKRVIQPIGYLIDLTEWYQTSPQGVAGSFGITIEVPETGLNEQTYNELIRLINDVKPVSRHLNKLAIAVYFWFGKNGYTVSRHLNKLAIAVSPTGKINAFVGQNSGDIITIYQ